MHDSYMYNQSTDKMHENYRCNVTKNYVNQRAFIISFNKEVFFLNHKHYVGW